jgi:hypothetical protein
MSQNFGTDWITRSDKIGSPPMPHTYGSFGERHDHKSNKAVIGVAILIVLSLVLYELRPSRAAPMPPAPPAITHLVGSTIG